MAKASQKWREFWAVVLFCLRFSAEASPGYFALSLGLNLVSVAVPFVQVYFSSRIIGILADGAGEAALWSLLACSAIVLAVTLLSKAVDNLRTYCEGMYQEVMKRRVDERVMRKAAQLDLAYFDSPEYFNELSDVNVNGVYIVQTAFHSFDFFKCLVQLAVALLSFLSFNLWCALLLGLAIVPNVIFQQKQISALYSLQRENWNEERKLSYDQRLMTERAFAKDVKTYRLFPMIREKYARTWDALFSKKRRLSKKYTVLLILSSYLPELVWAAIFFWMGAMVLRGEMVLGTYSYYQGIAGQVLSAMYLLVMNYTRLSDGKIRIQNFIRFESWESSVRDTGSRTVAPGPCTVEFRGVSFRYAPDLPFILRDVSFTMNFPEKVALVGVNGSGKSTVIKLLLRFYDPTEGQILLNGADLREYTLESLRASFSTMYQDYCSYAFNVEDSVSLSDWSREDREAQIGRALRESGVDRMVAGFPAGLKTYLTRQYEEQGVELSGGQWQKIALARTFFREAPIYILDEPSASLDAEAEDELFRKFAQLYRDRGAIFVSHRLSNITAFDKIVVLDHGTVAEVGSHRELMERGGTYEHLFTLQADKYVERR